MDAVVAMDNSGCSRGSVGWSSLLEEKKDAVKSLSVNAREQAGIITSAIEAVYKCSCPIYWAVVPDESGNYRNLEVKGFENAQN